MVLVPQEGFLFDDTLAANLRYGRLEATDAELLVSAADELGLADWLATLPRGLETKVGQRGESLSAGERQLVALLRAQLADPDLLVLDEATSAVDPALEMRIGRALERLMRGRTSVTIAHRLSTAENADEVVVVDRGRIVQRGPHAELVASTASTPACTPAGSPSRARAADQRRLAARASNRGLPPATDHKPRRTATARSPMPERAVPRPPDDWPWSPLPAILHTQLRPPEDTTASPDLTTD